MTEHGRVWNQVILSALAELTSKFKFALSKALGSDDLPSVARAMSEGRVGTLIVEADRRIPGRVDNLTGRIEPEGLDHPEVDDVLDDLAGSALQMKGDVVVLPGEKMPSSSGVAAIYRF